MKFDRASHTVHAAGRSWQADPARTIIEDHCFSDEPDWPGRRPYTHVTRCCLVHFESGWAASIIWGSGTYSSNHDAWGELLAGHDTPLIEEPSSVEVGVIDRTGELRMRRHVDTDGFEWHSVESYVTDDELAELLDRLRSMPSDYDYGAAPPSIDEVNELMRKVIDTQEDE